jgi:DNA-binding NarL/FixJ family response regulator
MIKVCIIDKSEFEQHKVQSMLTSQRDFEILGFGKDGYEALRIVVSGQPDVAILDIWLDYIDGIELIPLLKTRSPKTAVILLTASDDEDHICKAIANEVSAYVLKNNDKDFLCGIVRTVYYGGCFIDAKIMAKALPILSPLIRNRNTYVAGKSQSTDLRNHTFQNTTQPMLPGISAMELRIVRLVATGHSTKKIAEKLNITEGTTRNYISAIMQKIGLQNRHQLMLFGIKHKLVTI